MCTVELLLVIMEILYLTKLLYYCAVAAFTASLFLNTNNVKKCHSSFILVLGHLIINCPNSFLKSGSLLSSPLQRWTDTTTLSMSTTADWSFSSVRIHQRQRITNQQSFTGSWTRWATSTAKLLRKSRHWWPVVIWYLWLQLGGVHCVSVSSSPLLCRCQVCDKEWHHYVLNVEFPTVSLFVDGTTFEPFLVTEDYPLHPSKIETQLTIGACWQGKPMKKSVRLLQT